MENKRTLDENIPFLCEMISFFHCCFAATVPVSIFSGLCLRMCTSVRVYACSCSCVCVYACGEGVCEYIYLCLCVRMRTTEITIVSGTSGMWWWWRWYGVRKRNEGKRRLEYAQNGNKRKRASK